MGIDYKLMCEKCNAYADTWIKNAVKPCNAKHVIAFLNQHTLNPFCEVTLTPEEFVPDDAKECEKYKQWLSDDD